MMTYRHDMSHHDMSKILMIWRMTCRMSSGCVVGCVMNVMIYETTCHGDTRYMSLGICHGICHAVNMSWTYVVMVTMCHRICGSSHVTTMTYQKLICHHGKSPWHILMTRDMSWWYVIVDFSLPMVTVVISFFPTSWGPYLRGPPT